MALKCTAPCLEVSSCGLLRTVSPGAIFTPYVDVQIGTLRISTGNPSGAAADAIITSLEYGFEIGARGFGADIEILDSSGYVSREIIGYVNKTVAYAEKDRETISLDFGWIVTNANGTSVLDSVATYTGSRIKGIVKSVDQTFDGKFVRIKFSLVAIEHFDITPKDHVFGGDPTKEGEEPPMHLKQAITELLLEKCPKYPSVKFKNKDGGQLEFEATNTKEAQNGPLNRWMTSKRTKIEAVRSWLNTVRSKDKRGLLLITDPETGGIIIREDPIDRSASNTDFDFDCKFHVGTFIINGGNCSPVLEFKPTVNFLNSGTPSPVQTPAGASSSSGDPHDPEAKIQEDRKQDYGQGSSPTISENANTQTAPEDQAKSTSETHEAQVKTNAPTEITSPIEADLKIIGFVPYGLNITDLAFTTVSIIYLNPFHVENRGSGLQAGLKWYGLSESNCHRVLSNKQWAIKAINHQISSGTYTTTLRVYLMMPNNDIPYDQPYGGAGNVTPSKDPSPTQPVSCAE